MELTLNQRLHGFAVTELRPLPALKATLVRMRYEKNGADLIWLDRSDENKSFGIAFKTIPQDDTGVFHILEHSVLCGSDRYPLKEPFVDLLKCSLQTFLNAFTYGDKTVYPIASRNDQDFLNLMDVYLDAVLHPLSIHDPHAFRQEGWHYELESPDGELTRNGVVYNEMKGAYASGDSVLYQELQRAMFPDNCYGRDSGGDPKHITDLTYENYLESYHRFYHPSNSRIFLDGSIDLEAVLTKLDGFLRDYDAIDPASEIPLQAPVAPGERQIPYEIGPEEDPENKLLLGGAWMAARFDDPVASLAAQVLSRYLCGSNDAPLKKALLEAELCEDVEMDFDSGVQQQCLLLFARNSSPQKADKLWETVEATLKTLLREGLKREKLEAILNNLEFRLREKDFGSMPKGLVFGLSMLDTWLYDGDPAQNLDPAPALERLRQGLDEGFFEDYLKKTLLENPHHARVRLLPSTTLGEEKRRAEAEAMAKTKAAWSREEIQRTMDDFAELRRRQDAPDSPEARKSLPRLRLDEIPREETVVPQEESEILGRPLLRQPLTTDGIDYVELYFDLGDLPMARMPQLGLFSQLLGKVATEHYTPEELKSQLDGCLGRFDVRLSVISPKGQRAVATPYLTVSVSALASRRGDLRRLVREVLLSSRFDDEKAVYNLLRQGRLSLIENCTMSGNGVGMIRAESAFSAAGALSDALSGIGYLRWLQETDAGFAEKGARLLKDLSELRGRLTRGRVTVSLTGEAPASLAEELLGDLPEGRPGMRMSVPLNPLRREGFVIPTQVGFAVMGNNLFALGKEYRGSQLVAAQILTYDYLWNTIRVKGGAYGTGLRVRPGGGLGVYSYRDPSPAASLQSYRGAADSLRALADAGESLENYIISTVGESEPLLTPRTMGIRAAQDWLAGRTPEDRQKLRAEILDTTPADLRAFAEDLDRALAAPAVCVFGSGEALAACELDTVENLVK